MSTLLRGPCLRLHLPKIFFAIVTIMYAFVTPPFQVHDERNHYFKSYQLSEGTIYNGEQGGELGVPLPVQVGILADRQFPAETAGLRPSYRWSDLVAAWRQPITGNERPFTAFSNIANYAPSLYVPQALGILAARRIGAPLLAQFYTGRVFNALFGILLVLTAVSLMPFGRPAMMGFAALPMVSNQLGSLSADSSIIGLSFLALAGSLQLAQQTKPPKWALLGPVLFSLLALAKGVYLPLTLAGLAVRPRKRWYLVWLAASLMVAIMIAVTWLKLNSGNFVRQVFVGRRSLEHVRAALPAEQLSYVVSHPGTFAHTLITSFLERLPVYVIDGIGRFGWFTILLPIPIYALAMAVVGMAMAAPADTRPLWWQRLLWGFLLVGGCVLIETALYLTATELGADLIEGVQGRYFIPYLPLLGLILLLPMHVNTRTGQFAQVAFGPAIVGLMVAGLLVNAVSFWQV